MTKTCLDRLTVTQRYQAPRHFCVFKIKKDDCDASTTTCKDKTGDQAGFTCNCKSGYIKPNGHPNLSFCLPKACPHGQKFELDGCKDIDECNEGLSSK